jgi:hypothetical protein
MCGRLQYSNTSCCVGMLEGSERVLTLRPGVGNIYGAGGRAERPHSFCLAQDIADLRFADLRKKFACPFLLIFHWCSF